MFPSSSSHLLHNWESLAKEFWRLHLQLDFRLTFKILSPLVMIFKHLDYCFSALNHIDAKFHFAIGYGCCSTTSFSSSIIFKLKISCTKKTDKERSTWANSTSSPLLFSWQSIGPRNLRAWGSTPLYGLKCFYLFLTIVTIDKDVYFLWRPSLHLNIFVNQLMDNREKFQGNR